MRILPGRHHLSVRLLTGTGGVLRCAFDGAPKPSGVGGDSVDEPCGCPVAPGRPWPSRSHRLPGEVERTTCVVRPKHQGPLAFRQSLPGPFGIASGRGRPSAPASSLSTFGLPHLPRVLGSNPVHFREEGPFLAERRLLPNNPGRSRWRVGLFRSGMEHVPTGTRPHPFSGCHSVRGRHQHRLRVAGQVVFQSRSFTRVAPCART